ncbi:hypothetical protein 63302_22 [Lactococcus phage 63302]|uniref:Transglycosylase SLT domain-containing protein n=1 Tax=Lactococcus phage 63302 TaxID=2029670 RepID=A0A343JQ91_9CAUD|nr:transglycosylase [Lactococcus phage 63302]ASZ71664.1 hypothetical protein 63302_22 [Lactococcus phage 63302]
MIQKAHKRADKGFNDIVAQLYQQEFKTQEKAKYEHIRQAKEKAIEEQRISEENQRKEAIDNARERDREKSTVQDDNDSQDTDNSNAGLQTPEPTQQTNSSVIGNDWSQVSPEQASEYMSARTGVPVSTWQAIIYAESTNNPTITNSIGCFGYLQLHPVHGNVYSMTPQQYLDTAVGVYNSQGLSAWEVVTNGTVN